MQIDIQNPKKPPYKKILGDSILWKVNIFAIILYTFLLFYTYQSFTLTLITTLLFASVAPLSAYYKIKQYNATYQWQKVKATIIKKGIIQYHCTDSYANLDIKDIEAHIPYYSIDIKYKYTFDDVVYTSTKYALDAPCNWVYTLKNAQKIVIGLRKEIDVYVNPQKPTEAVVKQGVSQKYKPSYLIAITFNNIPIYLIFYAVYWG